MTVKNCAEYRPKRSLVVFRLELAERFRVHARDYHHRNAGISVCVLNALSRRPYWQGMDLRFVSERFAIETLLTN